MFRSIVQQEDIIWRIHHGRGAITFVAERDKSFAMVTLRLAPSFSPVPRSGSISMQQSDLKFQRTRLRQPQIFLDKTDCGLCQSQKELSMYPPLNQSVLAIICDDEPGTKLYPLTKRTSKSALPVSAHYRVIDFVVSNCINSDITKIYALTQFNSTSLNSHISRAYSNVGLGKDGFVEVLSTYQSSEELGWFKGNADAVRRWLWVLEEHQVNDFLVLPGHHLCVMDYGNLIKAHRDNGADITIAIGNNRSFDTCLSFLVDDTKHQFHELDLALDSVQNQSELVTTTIKYPNWDVETMGIYVISRDVLIKLLQEDFPQAYDFRTEVIHGAISLGMKVHAYMFEGHWNDLRSIEAFYQANMESITRPLSINFHDRQPATYTLPNYLPPTTASNAVIKNSIIGHGCLLNRCKISDSVIGMRTYVGDNAVIDKSVVMGNDMYQEDVQWNTPRSQASNIPIGIGEKTHIQNAIIDNNARIGKNVKIVNRDGVQECDREEHGYIISGGIVVILKNATIPDDSIL